MLQAWAAWAPDREGPDGAALVFDGGCEAGYEEAPDGAALVFDGGCEVGYEEGPEEAWLSEGQSEFEFAAPRPSELDAIPDGADLD